MKIVGQLVCGPGEADKHLRETLGEFKRLCDDVVVVTCNAGEAEKKLIHEYGFWQYEDNREWGRAQPDIKTDLLRRILRLRPDWILVLDADESLPTLVRSSLERLTVDRESCYFYVVNLWNDTQHYARALSFWNVRFYKADESKGVQFLRKPVHCGNAPPYFYNQPARHSYVPHILLHKGLMDATERQKRHERYAIFDPRAVHKGREYYDALIAQGSGSEYNQEQVVAKIQAYCQTL